jgi:glycosyltransferase involved in cell wall biosynthesis
VGPDDRAPCELLVVLHAARGSTAVLRSRREAPERPIVVAVTGTDVHPRVGPRALRALEAADLVVVLHRLAARALPPELRGKVRVVPQAAAPAPVRRPRPARPGFPVVVLGHLRPVKDPFRVAGAVRRLPPASRVRVVHAGHALTAGMARRAHEETRRGGRWRWVGGLSHRRAMRLLEESRLLVLPSRSEGGPGVLGEAVVRGVPVLASRIPATEGLLGRRHPGLFPAGDTERLAALLARAERDPRFYARLRRAGARRAPAFRPSRERRAWASIVRALVPAAGSEPGRAGPR